MLRVGINGFGRIGRAIFRSNLKNKYFDVVAINEINQNKDNIVYQLNYDTLYGQLDRKYSCIDNYIFNGNSKVRLFNEKKSRSHFKIRSS